MSLGGRPNTSMRSICYGKMAKFCGAAADQAEALLKKIVKSPVLYVDHLLGHGVDLFRAVFEGT